MSRGPNASPVLEGLIKHAPVTQQTFLNFPPPAALRKVDGILSTHAADDPLNPALRARAQPDMGTVFVAMGGGARKGLATVASQAGRGASTPWP